MKIYLNMPVGEYYGWAVCGKNLLSEMIKIADIKYIPDERYSAIQRDYKTNELVKSIVEMPNGKPYNALHCINNESPIKYRGSKNVGYMFWEQDTIPDYLAEQLRDYDIVATGSHWNTEVVKQYGIDAVTVHQGVNSEIFRPDFKYYFQDHFVIFSGGKLEHRKAQDIVAYVAGEMQRRHNDVILLANWANVFVDDENIKTQLDAVKKYLHPNKTVLFPVMNQHEIRRIMNESDIGLFPNRSEGGTNLVMMEYMACGKPVIANNSTGQKDVLANDRGLLFNGGSDEDIIEQCLNYMEFAYYNRDRLKPMGIGARKAMLDFTWEKTAKEFINLYEV